MTTETRIGPARAALRLGIVMLSTAAAHAFADEIALTNGTAADGYTLLVGDKKHWDTFVGKEPVHSASGYLSIEPDADNGAIKATWNGKGEAQVYLAHSAAMDLTPLVEQDAALVVLMRVETPPRRKVLLKMGCGYPCSSNAPIDKLLQALPAGEWLRVSFDLQCFADGGLDVANVDTPFLMLSRGKLSVSIADVRIVPGAAESAVVRCR